MISRAREFDADDDGARLTGVPMALASALATLDRGTAAIPLPANRDLVQVSHMMIADPFSGAGMAKLFATCQPMAARIERLEQMAGRGGVIRD